MTAGVEFLGWLEHGLRAEGCPRSVAGEQGSEFADDGVRLPRSSCLYENLSPKFSGRHVAGKSECAVEIREVSEPRAECDLADCPL